MKYKIGLNILHSRFGLILGLLNIYESRGTFDALPVLGVLAASLFIKSNYVSNFTQHKIELLYSDDYVEFNQVEP